MAVDEFEIIVAGPMSPDFLLDTAMGGVVLSSNARAYPAGELERVAPLFAGLPVLFKHVYHGPSRARLVMGSKGRVGRLTRAWWYQEEQQIRAILKVTSEHWLEEFVNIWERWRWGFSFDVDARAKTIGGLDVTTTIARLYSVDMELVEECAFGGRFADSLGLTADQLADKWDRFRLMRQSRLEGVI